MSQHTIFIELQNLLNRGVPVYLCTRGAKISLEDRIIGIQEDKYLLEDKPFGFIENIKHLVQYTGNIWIAYLEE